ARSKDKAWGLGVAGRQRTLSERCVKEVLLARVGVQANPAYIAALMENSSEALLNGGMAPSVNGDDDETKLSAASGGQIRAQLKQERRLVHDLTSTGAAVLGHGPQSAVPLTAHDHR